ncbi:MAG: hypothetical protein ACRDLF_07365 [Solirubrobacteraceae bacterium]
MTPRTPTTIRTNDTLIASGLVELATGALTGWPYALAIEDPQKARGLGIRSVPRLRQWHLDLIALGGLSVLIGSAVPELPRHVAWPLAVGAWTNANAFGVLALRPDLKEHLAYKAAAVGSFATVTWGFGALAVLGLRRRRAS